MSISKQTLKYLLAFIFVLQASLFSPTSIAQSEPELYENYRLHEPLSPISVEEVLEYKLSPNGQHVVFRLTNAFGAGLYSVSIKGGTITKLNDSSNPFENISHFEISPDGQWVVYRVAVGNLGGGEIWSVAINGSGDRVQESNILGAAANAAGRFIISKQNYLVYEVENGGSYALTGTQLRITSNWIGLTASSLSSAGVPVGRFEFSESGSFLVLIADIDVLDKSELYAWKLGVGGPAALSDRWKLNSPIDDAGDVNSDFIISPDGTRVIYSANQFGGAGDNLLYSADITGQSSTVTILNLSASPQKLGSFQVTPDSQKVIFEARLGTTGSDEVFNFYSVPLAGGTRTQLSPWNAGQEIRDSSFDISSDSQHLIYANNIFGPESNSDGGLFGLNLNESFVQTRRYNDNALPGAGSNYPPTADITPDGKTIIYRTSNSGQQSIYALPIDRFVPNNGVLLHSNPFTTSALAAISSNSEQVIYGQKLLGSSVFAPYSSLYVNDTQGGNAHQINTNPINTTIPFLDSVTITNNGQFAVYLGQETSGKIELFAVRIREADDEFCVPIKTANNKIAVICL